MHALKPPDMHYTVRLHKFRSALCCVAVPRGSLRCSIWRLAGLAQEEVIEGHAKRVHVGHELIHGGRQAEPLAEAFGDVEQRA